MSSQPYNQPADIPAELDRWNWGAFLLHWIWGIGNSVFIALLMFVPFVNLVMIFVLGARGSRWAWKNRAWRDAEHFRKTQRAWAIAGFVVWGLALAIVALVVVTVPRAMKSSGAFEMTMQAVRADERVREALGDDIEDAFWIWGNVQIQNSGGFASLSIPVSGSKGKGNVISEATRAGGNWTLRLVYVTVEGTDAPIVLINTGNLQIPNAPLGV